MPKENKNLGEGFLPIIPVAPRYLRGLIYKAKPLDIHHDRPYYSVVFCQ